ncbi:MAG: hypothetical protein U1E36_03995 [Rickettsiales bacterium]
MTCLFFADFAFAHEGQSKIDSLDPTNDSYLEKFCAYHPQSGLCYFTPNPPDNPQPTLSPVPSAMPPGNNPTHDGPAILVPPAKAACLTFRQPTGACVNSPTHKFLIGKCIANNNAPLSNASPCSQRYEQYWAMDLKPEDKGKTAMDVLRQRYGSITQQLAMYEAKGQSQQEMNQSMTVDYGPGNIMALQRNVKPGPIPSTAYTFRNFPSGTTAICVSMNVYFPTNFVGNRGGGKLGYGIWGGDRPAGGGTSMINQMNGQGFVVRNTIRYSPSTNTSLYSYHLNRGASGLWQVQNASKCDSSHCCLYGDSSARGTIPRGKWVRIEEEVVLNTLDQPNGYARLWIDGKQAGEITNMLIYESTAKMMIKGLFINDMWGGNINAPDHQATVNEKYWLTNYTVYH